MSRRGGIEKFIIEDNNEVLEYSVPWYMGDDGKIILDLKRASGFSLSKNESTDKQFTGERFCEWLNNNLGS